MTGRDTSTAEAVVTRAWCSVLQSDTATAEDDFFLLGGNSLLAVDLITQIESELRIEFPLEALFLDSRLGTLVQACVAALEGP